MCLVVVVGKVSKQVFALLTGICFLLLQVFAFMAPASASDSALTGLGEPADPSSMSQPGKLFPSSSQPMVVPSPTLTPVDNGITLLQTPSSSGLAALLADPNAIPAEPVLRQPISKSAPKINSSSAKNSKADPTSKTSSRQPQKPPDLIFRPRVEQQERSVTLVGAIEYANQNYPAIKKSLAQVQLSKDAVKLQKLNEYLPDSLLQYQLLVSTHNKITEMFYGSPVFPADPGPGHNAVSGRPYASSGVGASVDWAPIDFGLHKARIQYAKTQYQQAQADYDVTKLDVEIASASAFLDAVQAAEEVRAMQENVDSFNQFYTVVHAQVSTDLKPGADQSLASAQLANAQNQLLRAQLSQELALASLANAIGLGGQAVTIEARGIAANSEPKLVQKSSPVFENVPIIKASQALMMTAMAQRKVLNKEYAPVFHFLGGGSFRGAGENITATGSQSQGASGVFPSVPNYQVALIANWNFLDWFRIRQEKRVQDQRIVAQQEALNLVLQNIKTEDVKSRAQIRTAVALAANMPVQVEAADLAFRQAQARYKAGLGSVAQVAEANTVLAQSRMQEAIARLGVWRAMLQVAAVHGDMRPFMAEADRIQKGF